MWCEVMAKEMPTGWLSPNGELFKCEYYEHAATAEKICKTNNIPYNSYSYRGKDDALLLLGWCKLAIFSLGNKRYWVHWERPLTEQQRYFLKECFENEKDLLFPMDSTSLCKYWHEDVFFDPHTKKGGE